LTDKLQELLPRLQGDAGDFAFDELAARTLKNFHKLLSICCLILRDLVTTDLLELLVILLACVGRLCGDFRSRSLSLNRLPFINAV
jgi:hypothetical protein